MKFRIKYLIYLDPVSLIYSIYNDYLNKIKISYKYQPEEVQVTYITSVCTVSSEQHCQLQMAITKKVTGFSVHNFHIIYLNRLHKG